jgi:hypothetical protein
LETILCGIYIDKLYNNVVNVVIILGAFSVYKYRIIYNVTQKNTHITSLFNFELKRIDQIMSNSKKTLRIKVDNKMWNDTKYTLICSIVYVYLFIFDIFDIDLETINCRMLHVYR